MLRPVLIIATLVGVTTAVIAQSDPITERRNLMKGVGRASAIGGQLVKGETPFDPQKARDVLRAYGEAAEKMPGLFPDNSKEGGGTSAAPKIWESKADFDARFAAWNTEIKADEASVGTLDGFKTAFGGLTKACGGCHQNYRQKV